MPRHKSLLLITFFLLISFSLFSQDSLRSKKVKILPVPSFGYEPETETYVGAVSLFTLDFYQDGLTRTSNAKAEFSYTWRKQSIFEVEWDYFLREEQWFTQGEMHFSKYPDFYYGIGPDTPESNELLYESNRFIFEAGIFKNMGRQLFLGLGLRRLSYGNVDSETDHTFSELQSSAIFGLKAALFKDSRNSLLTPTSGKMYRLEAGYNVGDKDYFKTSLDLRRYHTLRQKHTLAIRLYNSFTINTPAFYDYAVLGGDDFVRGYFFGRFRDKHLSTLQAEFRSPLFWKLGFALFGGISSVYPNLSALTDRVRPNAGAGIRFLVDKEGNTNLRLDYAIGSSRQSGFYISFGESF